MINKRIEDLAEKLLSELSIDTIPIPINEIAQKRGIKILNYDFGDEISGVLAMNNGSPSIGVNFKESKVRRRFTIAHELAHYELHRNKSDLFIDKEFKLYFRDNNSSKGEDLNEREANAFAAAILMPRDKVIREIKSHKFDLTDEDVVRKLAQQFEVSSIAMSIRISNLNLF